MSIHKTPVMAIVGPTASGKSALAMEIAEKLGAEILCMDSMQVYRGMDIGTAKPTAAERAAVPHHLLDVAEPTEAFSVARYAELAEAAIAEVWARGRLPLLVGGTGFYLRALTDGLTLGGAPSDEAVRARLNAEAALPGGRRALHERLARVDPESAARLHENDLHRVARALEIYELTGRPLSRQEAPAAERPYDFLLLGVTMERAALYARINARVDGMLRAGLLGEVRGLLERGVPPGAQAMQGIGYKELVAVIRECAPLDAAADRIRLNSRHYAKKQWTWFRADSRVRWLDVSAPGCAAEAVRLGRVYMDERG